MTRVRLDHDAVVVGLLIHGREWDLIDPAEPIHPVYRVRRDGLEGEWVLRRIAGPGSDWYLGNDDYPVDP